ncbi:MAG: hypothetical protein EON98_00290 [Chitinophagaceae bacterium]|nr:MAG: hypothetical protein EON98_00290 [Chitinophagaceae bacterium]
MGELGLHEYLNLSDHGFDAFLVEFRIARNIPVVHRARLLDILADWRSSEPCHDVERLTNQLYNEGLTNGKRAVSLSSKVLMLESPSTICPIDRLVRARLGLAENDYEQYRTLLESYIIANEAAIQECFQNVSPYASVIEENFSEIAELPEIRRSRLIDKLLWTIQN